MKKNVQKICAALLTLVLLLNAVLPQTTLADELPSTGGATLQSGDYQVSSSKTLTGDAGKSGLYIASGAKVTI